jgi:hypothetical protein
MQKNESIAEKFLTLNPRRKIRNRLLRPSLQLAIPLMAILFTIVFILALSYTAYTAFEGIYSYVLTQAPIEGYLQGEIETQIHASIGLLIGITMTYVVLVMSSSVIISHHIVGPYVAFLRHIRALKNGDYASRVTLRKHDAFEDVAAELNELAQVLQDKSAGPR